MAIVEYILPIFTDPWTLLTTLLLLVIVYQIKNKYRLPVGPWGLPYLGYGPFLDVNKGKHISKLCLKYETDIISINNYGRLFVFLNSAELVKELFQKRTDFLDRLDDATFAKLDPGYGGIIGSNGEFWRETRRFGISVMRDFGMGRIQAQENIQNEARVLMEEFRGKTEAFDPKYFTNMAVSNVICTLAFGKRFEYDNKRFRSTLDAMNKMLGPISSQDHVTMFVKMVIQMLPGSLAKIVFSSRIDEMVTCYQDFYSFSHEGVTEHKRSYNGEVHDLIDAYFNEMEKRGEEDNKIFNERQAACLITDLFVAGSETTFTSLRWALLYMASFPEIQEKVHQELNDVIGPSRLPEMSDKKNTPYCEAVLSEIQRVNTLVPFGVMHANLVNDVEVKGYIIPKSTPVGVNYYQLHHDPQTWKNPEKFDPENFLQNGKVINLDKLNQFGIGRRACAGEALARMELYIFFASWMKDFEIKLETDDFKPDLDGYYGGTFMPTPFKVRMYERYSDK